MVRKICNTLTTIILILLAALAVLLLVPRFMGFRTLAVLSGSMEPNIPVGSIVYTKEIAPEELVAGDVLTYKINGTTMVTHRIVEVDTANKQFITKGDANEVNDGSPVIYDQVVGKAAFSVPLIGYISIYIRTPLGIAAICAVVFVMLLLNLLPELFEKKEKAPAENENESDKNM